MTKGWREIRLELDVPAEASAIAYGVVIAGEGTVEADDVEVTP